MKVIFIIFSVFILLLILPIRLKLFAKYNLLKNRGLLQVKLWGFRILFYRFKLNKNKIILKNKKETKSIDIDINNETIDFANELQKQFFKRFYLKQMTLKVTIGKDDNSFLVAICSGGIQMLMGAIIAFIKTEKPTSNLSFTVYPMYHKNSIAFSFNTRFSISITNLILCFFSAKYITNKKKRRKENGKKLQTSN